MASFNIFKRKVYKNDLSTYQSDNPSNSLTLIDGDNYYHIELSDISLNQGQAPNYSSYPTSIQAADKYDARAVLDALIMYIKDAPTSEVVDDIFFDSYSGNLVVSYSGTTENSNIGLSIPVSGDFDETTGVITFKDAGGNELFATDLSAINVQQDVTYNVSNDSIYVNVTTIAGSMGATHNILPYDSSLTDAENETQAINNTIALRELVEVSRQYGIKIYFPPTGVGSPYLFAGDGNGSVQFYVQNSDILGGRIATEGWSSDIRVLKNSQGELSPWVSLDNILVQNIEFNVYGKGGLPTADPSETHFTFSAEGSETKRSIFSNCEFSFYGSNIRIEKGLTEFKDCAFNDTNIITQSTSGDMQRLLFLYCHFHSSHLMEANSIDTIYAVDLIGCRGLPSIDYSYGARYFNIESCYDASLSLTADFLPGGFVKIKDNIDVTIDTIESSDGSPSLNISGNNFKDTDEYGTHNFPVVGNGFGEVVFENNFVYSDTDWHFYANNVIIVGNRFVANHIVLSNNSESFYFNNNEMRGFLATSYNASLVSGSASLKLAYIKNNVIIGVYTAIMDTAQGNILAVSRENDDDRLHYETDSFGSQIPFWS